MAKLEQYAYEPFPNYEEYDNIMEGFKAEDEALNKLFAKSEKLPEGKVVGAVLRWQRGDGYAYYIVTKERPLTLAFISAGDRWAVEDALIRGLTLADVKQMIASERKLRALWSRSTR